MYFTSIYLHSGGCCGLKDKEAPFKQSVSVGVSQASTSRAALSSLKTHFCQTCGPVLRDIFQLAEHQGTPHSQKVFRCGVCMKQFNCSGNLQTHQEQHLAEKPLRSSVDRTLFVKSYEFHVSEKPFTCDKVGKDFLSTSEHLQQQNTQVREEPNTITQSGATVQKRKTGSNL